MKLKFDFLSYFDRKNILSETIAEKIKALGKNNTINCIDVGCGDMSLTRKIKGIIPESQWKGIDLFPSSYMRDIDEEWKNRYMQFNGTTLPFENDKFDIAILVDVLHHAQDNAFHLLKDLQRKSRFIIIKDHFEYGFFTRIILILMDIAGNWAKKVKVPSRYFSYESFHEICDEAGLKIDKIEVGVNLYSKVPVLNRFLKPDLHFIAVLTTVRKFAIN
jgi:hypothetical protein